MPDRHDEQRYGTSDYRGQAAADREYQRQQELQREAERQRAHEEQMRALEPKQETPPTSRKSTKSTSTPAKNAKPQKRKADGDAEESGFFNVVIPIAGGIAGFWLAAVILQVESALAIGALVLGGAGISYMMRGLLKVLLRIAIVIGLIYVVFAYVLPALNS